MSIIDIPDVVEFTSPDVNQKHLHSHVIMKDVPAAPLRCFADGQALKQILLNLLSNAVKFTPQGGAVSVQLRTLSQLRQPSTSNLPYARTSCTKPGTATVLILRPHAIGELDEFA